jgi:hypothetical protein
MAPSLDVAIIRDTVLDAALALSTDPIPNIRFNVAKCLETLAVQCTNDAEGQDIIHRRIVPALKKLQEEDTDADVRYVPPFSFFLFIFIPLFLYFSLSFRHLLEMTLDNENRRDCEKTFSK